MSVCRRDVPIKLQNNKAFSGFVNTTAYSCSSGVMSGASTGPVGVGPVSTPTGTGNSNTSTTTVPPVPPSNTSTTTTNTTTTGATGPPPTTAAPTRLSQGYHQKTMCMVGVDVEVGLKAVIKQCSIGNGVKIGPRSKLNNCVVMDGVTIGEK